MRAYSFLFAVNVPEILFPFKKVTTHLATFSAHGIKQQASDKNYSNNSSDSGDRIVFEKLYASANGEQNQK